MEERALDCRQRWRALQAWIPEQHLEGDRRRAIVGANTREGAARGDAGRLGSRELLRGVWALRGSAADGTSGSFTGPDRADRRGNAANPRTGSGMQQARDPAAGGSRRGRAKRRGRNGTTEVEPQSPKPGESPAGVDPAGRVGGGEQSPGEADRTTRPRERRPDPSRPGALNGDEDHGGVPPEPAMAEAARSGRKTSEARRRR
jgi:hypothetical protein